jgi:hypothetical protein
MHFGVGLSDRDAVLFPRDRFVADGIETHRTLGRTDYVSFKCRELDGS